MALIEIRNSRIERDDPCCMSLLKKSDLSFDDIRELNALCDSVHDWDLFTEIYEKIRESSVYTHEQISLVRKVLLEFRDEKYAKQICIDILENFNPYSEEANYQWIDAHCEVAGIILQLFRDEKWSRSICRNLEMNIGDEETMELLNLSETVHKLFNDLDWSQTICSRAEKTLSEWTEYKVAADLLISIFNEKNSAAEFYTKSLKGTDDCMNKAWIAESIITKLGDKNWGRQILEDCENRIDGINTLISIIYSVIDSEGLNDRIWALKLLERIREFPRDEVDEVIIQSILDEYSIESTVNIRL